MKKLILRGVGLLFVLYISIGCSDGSNSKFKPEDRTTVNLSPAEKEAALASLKRSGAAMDSMLYSGYVKMSVLPPSSEELSNRQIEMIGVRMMQMLASEGVGGLNNVPGFALTASINPVKKEASASAPQKFLISYDVTYSVINTVNGDVYGSTVQTVSGVGSSFEQAFDNAINQIASDDAVAAMLRTSSNKIINWYDENLATFKAQVSDAEARNDYALALALIQSVPQQAKSAFAYAESRRGDIEKRFMHQIASDELVAMKQAIVESDNEPSSEVYAHYALIPSSSPAYSEAKAALNKYEKDVETKRIADSEQQKADLAAERQYQMELAKMENSRIKAKYQAQASEQAIKLYLSQNFGGGGFWKNLGARLIGAIDGTNWQFKVKDKPYTDD